MDQPSSWDSLRKQARKLEAQLDDQMHIYRKFVVTKADDGGKGNDLETEIEQLLKHLQQVNSHMQTWVSSGGSEIFSHTLTRHQEILQDLTQEFYRVKSSLRAKKEHASLLEGFREFDRARVDVEEGSDDQALLKEHASISRSTGQEMVKSDLIGKIEISYSSVQALIHMAHILDRAKLAELLTPTDNLAEMDNVISQAQATLGTLLFQRSTFGGINSKLANIGSRLPTVNQVLTAIKRKKSMDTIILSLVASVCTFLMLIYWMSK